MAAREPVPWIRPAPTSELALEHALDRVNIRGLVELLEMTDAGGPSARRGLRSLLDIPLGGKPHEMAGRDGRPVTVMEGATPMKGLIVQAMRDALDATERGESEFVADQFLWELASIRRRLSGADVPDVVPPEPLPDDYFIDETEDEL